MPQAKAQDTVLVTGALGPIRLWKNEYSLHHDLVSDKEEKMAQEAQRMGYEYIAITDHAKGLPMTGGLDEKQILKQIKEIQEINYKLKTKNYKFRVLTGLEVNIMKDGSLDISDKVLAQLDIVGAAIHSHFNLPREQQTTRLIRAIKNPNVDIIFHPTGRLLKRREEIALDIDAIFEASKSTGTILEINSFPDRLDLKDEYIRKAREMGLRFVINTDSHSISHLHYMEFGVAQARRAWCQKKDIINTLPLKEFLKALK